MSPTPDGVRPAAAGVLRTRPVLPVVAVAGVLYAGFVALRLAAFDWDVSAFVVAGDGVTDPAAAPAGLGVSTGTNGYDGQAYYRLARDPLTDEITAHGITYTRPAYWQSRIGYPLSVWAVSLGGRAALMGVAMLAVNLAAVLAMAGGAAVLARRAGRAAWWGLVPALWAGYVIGVGQDLTEPLAGALLVGALLALHRGHAVGAALALTAAALTRETALVLAVAIVLAWLWSRVRSGSAPPWWVGAVPLAVYAGWRTWVRARWADVVPDPPSDSPLTWPLVELGRYLQHAAGHLPGEADNLVLLVPTLAVLVVLVIVALRSADPGDGYLRIALVAYLVVLACLPVWDRGQAYLRWCCEPVLLGWLLALGRPSDPRTSRSESTALAPTLAALVAVTWVAAVAVTHSYPDPDRWVPADERTDAR